MPICSWQNDVISSLPPSKRSVQVGPESWWLWLSTSDYNPGGGLCLKGNQELFLLITLCIVLSTRDKSSPL